jgi:hypothetical protein
MAVWRADSPQSNPTIVVLVRLTQAVGRAHEAQKKVIAAAT